jgi:uncharacterized OB-fold protein
MDFPVPDLDYAPLQSFWTNAAEKRLVFPRCEDCAKFVWYPQENCPYCAGANLQWKHVPGTARIFSFAQVRRALYAPFKAIVPYVPVIVIFDDAPGVRYVSRWVNQDQPLPSIGQTATIVFEDLGYPNVKTGQIAPLMK